jgi:uncharacterized membrane protein YecN with MAPEG domain
MNTLELLICLIPSLLISAQLWTPEVIAGIGLIFFVGRIIYFKTYISNPEKRTVGFALSITPVFILLLSIIIGVVRDLT